MFSQVAAGVCVPSIGVWTFGTAHRGDQEHEAVVHDSTAEPDKRQQECRAPKPPREQLLQQVNKGGGLIL